MNATKLRPILIVGFVILVGLAIAGGWWAQQLLTQKVTEANRSQIDANISQQRINELKRLQGELAKQKDVVARAGQIAATSSQYQYQDQVIQDIQSYASRHGITVAGFDFSSTSTSTKAPAGTILTQFSVTLKGSISYDVFMAFLRDVENNLTKIQVSKLNLTPNSKNPKLIDNPTLGSAVYLLKK